MQEETKYNSHIKTLVLDFIEETGDGFFMIDTYPMIVQHGEIAIDRSNAELNAVAHTPGLKSSIGVKDGKTILVQVSGGRGVTVKELAQYMVDMGCTFASVTGSLVIDVYEALSSGVTIVPPTELERESVREAIRKEKEEVLKDPARQAAIEAMVEKLKQDKAPTTTKKSTKKK